MSQIGGWRCLDCGHVSAAAIDPDAIPTCGQREVMYCSRCEDVKCLEYTLVSAPMPRKTVAAPIAQGFKPTHNQQVAMSGWGMTVEATTLPTPLGQPTEHAVISSAPEGFPSALAQAPPLGRGNTISLPSSDSLSDFTVEALHKLHATVKEYEAKIAAELRDRMLCVICYTGAKDIVLYPCKHKCVCQACAEKVQECPICRTKIVDKILPFET